MRMLRSSKPAGAANDNSRPSRKLHRGIGSRGFPKPLRAGTHSAGSGTFRLVPIAALSACVLVGLSGAFLVGLAAVGILAIVLAAFDLIRRHMFSRRPSGHAAA